MKKESEIVDLGYANGWGDNPPPKYKLHKENCGELVRIRDDYSCRKVNVKTEKLGRNLHQYTCRECGIRWREDSSG